MYKSKIFVLIGWAQLVVCILILLFILFSIFIQNSINWYYLLKAGVIIQLVLFGLTSFLQRRLNKTWFSLILTILFLLIINELESNNITQLQIFNGESGIAMTFLFIIFSIGLYALSLIPIIAQLRNVMKKQLEEPNGGI